MNATLTDSPLFDQIVIDNTLRVLVNAYTGSIVAVQDARTGLAADFLYSRSQIARAKEAARNAWQSTADLS